VERELKDGDQIGLLPSSYFFRVSFSTDVNNNNDNNDNNDSDLDSLYAWKKEEALSPVRTTSPDHWSPIHGHRRSISNQDISVFDFDEDINIEPTRAPCKRTSFEKKTTSDIESEPCISVEKKTTSDIESEPCISVEKKTTPDTELKPCVSLSVPCISLTRVSIPSPSAEDQVCFYDDGMSSFSWVQFLG